MLLSEIFDTSETGEDIITESASQVYARRKTKNGDKIVRKYRCIGGMKSGRIVSNPAACSKAIDPKRRMIAKRTMSKKGKMIARKRAKAMKRNPTTLRVQRLNKASKGKRK